MKKCPLYTTFLCCLSTIPILKGQVPFMDSTYTWTEVEYYILGHSSFRRTMASEPTIYNGKTYYEILSSPMEEGGNWQNTWIFLRYEDQKLYQGYTSGEMLVFDFNLNVHDTFDRYIVTGIDTILLANGESRKRLETQCDAWGDWPVYWIEGIGSSAGLAQIYSTCAFDAGGELLCVWKDEELLYSNPAVDSCWFIAVSTIDIHETNISIYPNPVEDLLIITDPDRVIDQVILYDLFGRMVYSGKEFNIPMIDFSKGYYLAFFF
jgi:hypothetical protein